jgi:isoquinoline 1-oxidoreductase beta subunit
MENHEVLRLLDVPKVEAVIRPTYDFWGGVGDPTTPAMFNAIHALTGKPVRSLPLKSLKLA